MTDDAAQQKRSALPKLTMTEILWFLNDQQVRATYDAVAACIGGIPQGVSQKLGDRCPEASWIVSAADGYPTGYSRDEMHPSLLRSPRVIVTGDELRSLIRDWRVAKASKR